MPGAIVVRGHTDAHPYRSRTYDNWRLSSARAQMAYYMLNRGGVEEKRFERIEGFAPPSDWQRAYAEINAFEEQLAEHGNVIVKFWLAITQDEQLRRFKDRQTTPYKQYKITEEDWRNRAKWNAYAGARRRG